MHDLDPAARSLARAIRKLPILYHDDALVAVDKPPGLLVVPDRVDAEAPTLRHEFTKRLQREAALPGDGELFVVRRLDRGTSGVVLFAKNRDAHGALSRMFAEYRVHRTYHAIVHGEVEDDSGRIDLPIGPAPKSHDRMIVRKRKGRASQTDFAVLDRFLFYTHLRLHPLTGRQHQMRVHLQALGHPVVGDGLYGVARGIFLSDIKRSYRLKPGKEERPLMGRLALHAAKIELAHPLTSQPITIEARLPRDFRATLRNLERFLRH